ncbi:MAG: methylation-associated defense system protein MAD4 [Candidatus Hydrogenedentota bacterium]
MTKRDLFVAVADLDAENVIKTLLSQRQLSLGIELDFNANPPPRGDLLRYSGRDSGCYGKAADILRGAQDTHRHAMLLLDRHGSGAESKPREDIEVELEKRLRQNGWADDNVCVIVFDPELEAWVWADSPHVSDVLGWTNERDQLRRHLGDKGLWPHKTPKPPNPKEAMEEALRTKKAGPPAPLFRKLASRVSLERCHDPAFIKFKTGLRRWFGK